MAQKSFDYGPLDRFKRTAQIAAAKTARNIRDFVGGEFQEVAWSRGESAYLIEATGSYLGHVEEGLGTKNLVADAMYALTGKSFYDVVGQDTVAMIVNDSATLGVRALSIAMHIAVGESSWFDDEKRAQDLIAGWSHACGLARCAWGCGETPTLEGIIKPGAALLSGSVMGLIKPKKHLIYPANIREGDAIVIIESSGVHANGLTDARRLAADLPIGYLTPICEGGQTYGEALLAPTHIYAGLVEDCLASGVAIHYAVNITGHGWRKLMRAPQSFAYVIDKLPSQLPIFDFIQRRTKFSTKKMYGMYNMGAGYALYVPEKQVGTVVDIADSQGLFAFQAGHIEMSAAKLVHIKPKGIFFGSDSLAIR